MEKTDHDSKAALRVRCPACGRSAAQHPFCAFCGKPKLCSRVPDDEVCGGCTAEPPRHTKPTGVT